MSEERLMLEEGLGDEQIEQGRADEREALSVADLVVAVFYAWAANTAVR